MLKWRQMAGGMLVAACLSACGQAPIATPALQAASGLQARDANPFEGLTVLSTVRTRFTDDYQLTAGRMVKDRWGKPSLVNSTLILASVKGETVTFQHVALKGEFITPAQRGQLAQALETAAAKVQHNPEVVRAIAKALTTQYPGKTEAVTLKLSPEVAGYLDAHLAQVQKDHAGQAVTAEVTAKASRDVFHTTYEGSVTARGAKAGRLEVPMKGPRGEVAYYLEVRVTAGDKALPLHYISNLGKNFKGTLSAKK